MGISSYESLKARVSSDGMKGYLTLLPGGAVAHFTKYELAEFLRRRNIVFGIDEHMLERIAANPEAGKEYCIATGVDPVDAKDGTLEYKFEAKPSHRPKVNEDGSLDYWSIHLVNVVHVGDVIAVATDPTEPKNGTRVTGEAVFAKRGKPAPPLRGKGYKVSEDGHTYTAVLNGKIELIHGGVRISEVHEVNGNAGLSTGIIDFHGDVVIHGNVKPGAIIKATGSVTVDGTCESCTIEAGKDVILRGGVLGGHKTTIKSMGMVHAKFFEYCRVFAEGGVMAESALDSVIDSYRTIEFTGKNTGLVGGITYATEGVIANTIGNDSEIRTEVIVGVKVELMRELYDNKKHKSDVDSVIAKINAGLKQYEDFSTAHGKNAEQEERRVALFRTRMMKQADSATLEKKITHIQEIIDRGKGATVEVSYEIFPGTTVSIDGFVNIVRTKQKSVRFELDEAGEHVVMISRNGSYLR